MIVFRYLFKEVIYSTLGVTSVLLMVIMSGRFIKYLGKAASGEMSPDVIFILIGFEKSLLMFLVTHFVFD